MNTAPPLVVEQAIYGSRSGDRDYRVLATSTRFSREEQDALEQFANLGGSALSAETVEPIFLSFPLGAGARPERPERWAFARGVVLARGVRGNDYLVHALILDRATLAALRGDLFLLAERARFASEKPRGEALPSLPLDPQEIAHAAARALGSDLTSGLTLAHLAPLLSTLTEAQALAAQLTDGAFATALVRAMLSALPPDDRIGFAFTTRFCQPRALPFRFAAFVQEDRDLATRFLGAAIRPLARGLDGVAAWLSLLDRAQMSSGRGLEPTFGISLLALPEHAAKLVEPFAALDLDGKGPTESYRGRIGPAFAFAHAKDAARWIADTLVVSEAFAVDLLARWFKRWREVDGETMLFPLAEILIELPAKLSLTPILAALEAAAPPQSEARASWFGALFKVLRDPLGPRFPLPFAARLAADEGLLGTLEPDDLEAVAPVLAAQMPRLLDEARLAALPTQALAVLVAVCHRGLTHEPRWDLVQAPERARLIERLAVATAQRLAPQTLALVRSALGRAEIAGGALRTALETLLRAPRAALPASLPAGGAAAAVGLLARFRSRLGGRPSFTVLEFSEVRARALRDARECAPSGAGWPVLIWLEAIRS